MESCSVDTSRGMAGPALQLRPATRADVAFIVDAIAAASRHGHFGCDVDRADVMRGLGFQVDTVVADGRMPMPGARDGVGGQAIVIDVDEAHAGFAILIEHVPGSWHDRVELFAMVVDERFRGRGLGRELVRFVATWAQSRVVAARCAPVSTGMRRVLEACGFVAATADGDGVVTLELHRPAA